MNPNKPGAIMHVVPPLFCLAIGAVTFLFWATAQGVGVSPDSTVYLEAASSLLNGKGFEVAGRPMTHYPPLYPMVLAVAGMIAGGDVIIGSRFLHALLFGLNSALVGLVVRRYAGQRIVWPILATLLFVSSPAIIQIHWMAWSEPLFLALVLLLGLSLARFIDSGKPVFLIAASVVGGLALITRYSGIALLPAVFLLLTLVGARPFVIRLRDAMWVAILIGAPLASWLFRNMQVAQTATNRAFAFHPPGLPHAREFLEAVAEFVVPFRVSLGLPELMLAGCVLVTIYLLGKAQDRPQPGYGRFAKLPILVVVFATFGFCYMTFLLASITFFDAATPMDSRMLLPAVVSISIAGAGVLARTVKPASSRIIPLLALSVAWAMVCLNATSAAHEGARSHNEGIGFSSLDWKTSALVAAVKTLGQSVQIYSNGADALSHLTGTVVVPFPERINPTSRLANPRYEEQIMMVIEQCRTGIAVIIQVEKIDWRWYLPSGGELAKKYDLPIRQKVKDGMIYCLPPGGAAR